MNPLCDLMNTSWSCTGRRTWEQSRALSLVIPMDFSHGCIFPLLRDKPGSSLLGWDLFPLFLSNLWWFCCCKGLCMFLSCHWFSFSSFFKHPALCFTGCHTDILLYMNISSAAAGIRKGKITQKTPPKIGCSLHPLPAGRNVILFHSSDAHTGNHSQGLQNVLCIEGKNSSITLRHFLW